MVVVVLKKDVFIEMLENFSLWKILRIWVWIVRFFISCKRSKLIIINGLLIIDEIKF